ncbi:MAG: aldehyde dehydrogenase family protein, partial [Kiloniellales bacterium]
MLDFDPAAQSLPCGHFIDGALLADPSRPIAVRRPCDGAVYAEIPTANQEMVDRAVCSARDAFRRTAWARQAPRDRARVLRRWADLIDGRRTELAQLEALGSTRPIAQAAGWDVPYLAETIRFFAELADKHGGELAATAGDRLGFTLAEPYGVVAAIAPWNFPLV